MTSKKRILTGITLIMAVCLFFPTDNATAMQKSYEYGNVKMDASGENNAAGPVIFRHWSHRDRYTCRLCHVDLEFSQYAGDTMVLEADNREGRYCGACHNGQEAFAIKDNCDKCHMKTEAEEKLLDRQAKKRFFKFKKNMPRATYGNKIDWMKAEEQGKIKLQDSLPGISFARNATMVNKREEPRAAKLPGLPNIVFSHKKHVVWSGCGMCHPDTYAMETGKTKMTMKEITAGEFCGRCHGYVAFPLNDCTRCHSQPVTQEK